MSATVRPVLSCFPSVFFCGSNTNSDLVTGQDFEHLIRGNENFSAVSRHRKAVAVLCSLHRGLGALVLGLEFVSKTLELCHRVAIEHSRYRLLQRYSCRGLGFIEIPCAMTLSQGVMLSNFWPPVREESCWILVQEALTVASTSVYWTGPKFGE